MSGFEVHGRGPVQWPCSAARPMSRHCSSEGKAVVSATRPCRARAPD
ncbi:Hypothetical protein AA314_04586 [Archangium gephyra]|uniref:Uncharacterized protein n=1 Tax=Archangium gephyra TaxID=48 RepID=A0AAC8Q8Q0_9BACT|nr:Hypothetical protein AA314_04586 [Archangium gephyra]